MLTDRQLYSDLSISQNDTYLEHKNLIDAGRYSDAVALLKKSNVDATVAEMLNNWEQDIYQIQQNIEKTKFHEPYFIKSTTPTSAEMSDHEIWLKTY